MEIRDMNSIDLSGLIKGLMVVIAIAIAAGRLSELKHWAAHEAFAPSSSRFTPFLPRVEQNHE
jgi:hypothetical protein